MSWCCREFRDFHKSLSWLLPLRRDFLLSLTVGLISGVQDRYTPVCRCVWQWTQWVSIRRNWPMYATSVSRSSSSSWSWLNGRNTSPPSASWVLTTRYDISVTCIQNSFSRLTRGLATSHQSATRSFLWYGWKTPRGPPDGALLPCVGRGKLLEWAGPYWTACV